MNLPIPVEYEQFLATHGVFEGFTVGDDMPGYVALWPLAEISGNNADIVIQEHAPGYLAFAGNGGGEVLAFDATGAVYMLPLIGMEPRYAVRVANSSGDLAARFELAA
ncbi:SMI1/KNR4 family protein [Pseudoxanthomonas sp. SE1]|uniref:SMI1/KNR4 family protein n=1 Tax=Pseudoxanthomonas sp. SE1 TaxID=1664560 RepID=UPI00240D802A|nr:SMI1/KNR4 family protein [Pseudoxanthomonas sp. SE1]WFC40544.1 SMI1/KNR4 family protein [Pseudoxanthomonas sp. SE1]